MRTFLASLGLAVCLSAVALAGCGGMTDDVTCGIAACVPDSDPGPRPTPAPEPTPEQAPLPSPQPQEPGLRCVASLDDGFETGAWSPTWDERRGPQTSPARDDTAVIALDGDGRRGNVLSVFGQGTTSGYAAAAALTMHTTCMPARARFAFDYRIDEGSLDASRDDLAEIAEITAMSPTGVMCGVLVHVQQGRLSATTGPRIELGEIAAQTWTRLEMIVDGSDVSFSRDGQVIGSLAMGCAPKTGSVVRVSVSGGRSIAPGSYRAFFDDVRFDAAQ